MINSSLLCDVFFVDDDNYDDKYHRDYADVHDPDIDYDDDSFAIIIFIYLCNEQRSNDTPHLGTIISRKVIDC